MVLGIRFGFGPLSTEQTGSDPKYTSQFHHYFICDASQIFVLPIQCIYFSTGNPLIIFIKKLFY
jgi:hypothetical protein